ncbi:MAG: VWA domain-containing protein [Cellvibrionaceae bacterium]|nr:VWA domain-containing protein [Cellvibrionaceae bacterium]
MALLEHFHFLRPWWLAAVLPAWWLCYLLWRQRHQHASLERYIAKDLLALITLGKAKTQTKTLFIALAALTGLTLLALAGPTWKKLPQAQYISESALVIALDLSPSMMATDIKPSRLVRARLKIQELLKQRRDGLSALIVYAGEAFTVTPFTRDTRTIANLLPTLTPGLLPVPGSNVEMSLELAKDLLRNSQLQQGSLLLVTDNITPAAIKTLEKNLGDSLQLLILGMGTDKGAPIPSENGHLKDSKQQTIVAKRNSDAMAALAAAVSGYYLPLQADDSDIDFILDSIDTNFRSADEGANKDNNTDQWHEFGPTLLLLALPLLALGFRRGYLLPCLFIGLFLTTTLPAPLQAQALNPDNTKTSNTETKNTSTPFWERLWKNSNQQALTDWQQEDYHSAAATFNNPQWRGSAHYKQGNYAQALDDFAQDSSAIGDYNRGNSLAQLGRYEDAIAAYDAALSKQPNFKQAQENKQLLEQLQQEQEQQEQQNSNNQNEHQDSNPSSSAADPSDQQQQNQQESTAQQQDSQQGSQQQNQKQDSQQQRTTENTEQSEQSEQQATSTNDKNNKQQAQQEKASASTAAQTDQASAENATDDALADLSTEQQQALQQWLRKIPDDPSGLLRRKFDYEYRKRSQLYQQGQWQLPKNNAHQRY